jgi:acyl-coenzyme A thioesterase PaaI-like protein
MSAGEKDSPDATSQSRQAQRDAALELLAGTVPYNRLLGVRFDRLGDELTGRLPYKEMLIGNPVLPALHGGVTGSFLEITALMQLGWDQVLGRMNLGGEGAACIARGDFPPFPKTIDITIDYLRPGLPRDTFARATVQKAGRRVANLHVEAWQDSRARPIAMLRGNFLMPG